MTRADKSGRPWWALVPTLVVGGGLAFINVTATGATVFTWFSDLTSLITLFGWGMICFTHIRMRHAWKVQGRPVSELPWKTWTFPIAAWWGVIWCLILVVAEFYLSVWPLDAEQSAENFFANFVSVPAAVVIYLGARLYFRLHDGLGWYVDSRTIDLDEGRRFYSAQENEDVENSAVDKKRFGWARKAFKQ